MSIERRVMAFEIKATSGDGSTGEGIASAFHNIDSYDDIVAPGAFTPDLAEFLVSGFVGGLNHDWNNPIGSPTAAEEVGEGLKVAWKLEPTAHGKDVMILLKGRVVKKLSIGYRTKDAAMLETAKDVEAYWTEHGYTPSDEDLARSRYGGIRLLKRIALFEFSPVTLPANMQANITLVKSGVLPSEREFERLLREAGFSRNQAETVTLRGFKSLREAEKTDPQREAESEMFNTGSLRLRAEQRQIQLRLHAKGLL